MSPVIRRALLTVMLGGVLLTAHSASAATCAGDCDGDGSVGINEIIGCVNIALGSAMPSACAPCDADGSGEVEITDIVADINNALNGCPAVTAIFPADYRASYTQVRDCRFSLEHDSVNIRVWANPIAAQPYLDNQNPLPVGSVVIKEEFDGADCSDDSTLLRWRAMRKEAPGFDPADGDWHWQRVGADRAVISDDKSTCIGCHTRTDCLVRDHMCTEAGSTQTNPVELVFQEQPAALLSIAGTSPTDMYAVGADPPNDDFGPYVLHYDGQRWVRLKTGATGDLWWISVAPIDGSFYMAGEGGLILRYDLTTGRFEKQVTPGTQTMFGVWGTHADSIWAVGGDPNDEVAGGVVWHYDGTSWSVQDLSVSQLQRVPGLLKVWGRSDSDIYAVGLAGFIMHYDGATWKQIPSGTQITLFTVHGNDNIVAASGGLVDGVIVELAGDHFVNRTPSGASQANGVFIPPDGKGVSAGAQGEVLLRNDAGWQIQTPAVNTTRDFHAVWVDSEGGIWAVGGDLSVDLNHGMLAYGGMRTISSEIVQLSKCPPGTTGGAATVSYMNDVVPLLTASANGCTTATCHAGPFPASGYSLTTYAKIFGPGVEANSLQACEVVPGNPDASFLIEKLGASPRIPVQMPGFGRSPLTAAQIDMIRTWILEGAQNN